MASTLSALVASAESIRTQLESGTPIIGLPQEFALVPLTERESDDGVTYLTPAVAARAAQWSETAPVAYIEGETDGGAGTQIAVVWRSGAISWGPRYTCNNEADVDDLFVYMSDPADYATNA